MRQPATDTPPYGIAEPVAPGIRRLLCNNPSPFTYLGTNTYLVGDGGGIAVIDPGPDAPGHRDAIMAALRPGEHISHIVVTHAHGDHTPLAGPLSVDTGAPVLAYGPATRGQSEIMRDLSAGAALGGGEGIDASFAPDQQLEDGEEIVGDGWKLLALWTPGHLCNHLSFDCDTGSGYGTVFTGDHVMGWSTSIVSPPDGDLTQFMESCDKLRSRPASLYLPGHGAEVTDPHARLDWLIAHRRGRETSILDALADGPNDAASLAARVYTDTPPELLPAATRNVLAHLIDLTVNSKVAPVGDLSIDGVFRLL